MTYKEAREAAAKAMHNSVFEDEWQHISENSIVRASVFQQLDAALSAFSAAGYEVVPKHCTDEMAAAIDLQDWPTPDIYGDITPGRAPEHIWSAMIQAALKERT